MTDALTHCILFNNSGYTEFSAQFKDETKTLFSSDKGCGMCYPVWDGAYKRTLANWKE